MKTSMIKCNGVIAACVVTVAIVLLWRLFSSEVTPKPRHKFHQSSSDLAGKTPHWQGQLMRKHKGHISSETAAKSNISSLKKHLAAPSPLNSSSSLKKTTPALVDFLTKELEKKLDGAKDMENLTQVTCQSMGIQYTEPDCHQTSEHPCPHLSLPVNLRDRVESLVLRESLQIPDKYREVIKDMSRALPGHYDVILLSAMSSNHYLEGQAMLKDMHEKVFPQLINFTLVIYDLGLTPEERKELKTYCRCTVLDFPFELFPPHFRTLKCFAWKPTIIRAHYERANFLIWSDASVRTDKPKAIPGMIERARERGIQQRFNTLEFRNPYHTLGQTFAIFGDSPCAHMSYSEAEACYGIYHREPLVETAIMDPWYGCALRADCVCPVDQKLVQDCPNPRGKKTLGLCMRNDQSAITIITAKLFREKFHHFVVNLDWFQAIRRNHKYPYFDEFHEMRLSLGIYCALFLMLVCLLVAMLCL